MLFLSLLVLLEYCCVFSGVASDRHHVQPADAVGEHAGPAAEPDRDLRQWQPHHHGQHEWQGRTAEWFHGRGRRQPQLPPWTHCARHQGVQHDQG